MDGFCGLIGGISAFGKRVTNGDDTENTTACGQHLAVFTKLGTCHVNVGFRVGFGIGGFDICVRARRVRRTRAPRRPPAPA